MRLVGNYKRQHQINLVQVYKMRDKKGRCPSCHKQEDARIFKKLKNKKEVN